MLTDAEIRDADITKLDAPGQLALTKLVRRSEVYRRAIGVYSDLETTVTQTVTDGTTGTPSAMQAAKAKALAAVLTKLSGIPGILVEDEGTDKARTFFSSSGNWEELARDVLDTMYEAPALMEQMFGVVDRAFGAVCGGCRPNNDEMFCTSGGYYIYIYGSPVRVF